MDPVLAAQIVACLNVSRESTVEFNPPRVSGRLWERGLDWLDHSGLALIFWSRLKAMGRSHSVPSSVGEGLEQSLVDHRLRVMAMMAEFSSINQCLESAGIRYAAMKGLALNSDYCPDMTLRPTYDFDYLVARDSMEAAEIALGAAGYRRTKSPEEHPIVYFHEAFPPRAPRSRHDLYSAAFPRTIELHNRFWDGEPFRIPLNIATDPLDRLERREIGAVPNHAGLLSLGGPVRSYALAEEDDLLFQVLHVFRHILHDWCRLCSLLDIANFLDRRGSDGIFWEAFLRRLAPSRELREIVGLVFALVASLFGAKIPDHVEIHTTGQLRPSLVCWMDRYGKASALQNFSNNKFSLFLHHEFIHDAAIWRALKRSRLYPLHPPNTVPPDAELSLGPRLVAKWNRGRYVVQRLKHHLTAGVRYELESRRWERARGN